ncbi:Uncharacterised protein [Actinobacillus equuli]|nr:Uncharacterised protein [Actinobacillus equuli]
MAEGAEEDANATSYEDLLNEKMMRLKDKKGQPLAKNLKARRKIIAGS